MKKWNALEGILCLLIMASCTKTEKLPVLERGTAVITGKVYNLSENNRTIRFTAESSVEKSIEHTAHIDSEGNFRSELELYHPQDVRGFFKKKSIRLYLRPSDSIHIELDEALFSKENLPDFRISGTSPDAEISAEIKQYVKYCGEIHFILMQREYR
jgi:hypothetical protein